MYNRPSLAEEAYFHRLNTELQRRLARREQQADARGDVAELMALESVVQPEAPFRKRS